MLFLRPVKDSDLPALLAMSVEAGTGMTTMPNDETTWVERILLSRRTFAREVAEDEESVFFLVAEDSETAELVGTTAIYTNVGSKTPFFSYKLSLNTQYSALLDKNIRSRCLFLVNDFTGKTEVGSLFLREKYRHSGHGQFLSRARYLLLSDFPGLFSDTVIAELRGWQDEQGRSPFWQALGKKFFDLPFKNADYLNAIKGSQFISDLMPKYPVYLELLPDSAQQVVGKPHRVSAAAVNLLKKEGFYHDNYVDIFDGGPTYQCRRDQIRSVRARRDTVAHRRCDRPQGATGRYIVSNKNIEHYRIALSSAELQPDGGFALDGESWRALALPPSSAEGASPLINVLAMQEKRV